MVDFIRVLQVTSSPGPCYGCAHSDSACCNQVDGVVVPVAQGCLAEGGSKYIWKAVSQPSSRSTDPATSKAAGASIKAKVPSLKETILFLLERNPGGLTGTQMAELSGKRLNSITPRFAELRRDRKIDSLIGYRNGETVWVREKSYE